MQFPLANPFVRTAWHLSNIHEAVRALVQVAQRPASRHESDALFGY